MFNSTHTLVGLAIARTGAGRWAKYGTATAVIAANLPDIDIVTSFWGTAAYLDHHRGITHSIVGIPFLALLLACAMYFFSGNFGKTYAIALIAMATHPMLDFLNSYGYRPFLPWSAKWFYGDLLFIIDPYIDVALLVGILLGWKWPNWKKVGAFISLGLATLYIGAKVQLHSMAINQVAPLISGHPEIKKWAAVPNIDPRTWKFFVDSASEVGSFDVDTPPQPQIDAGWVILPHPPSTEMILRASHTRSAAALLRFARFPVTRVETLPSGYRVSFLDFAFVRAGRTLAAVITLDESMHVVAENLSFAQSFD
jgi:inner membrane protein